MKNIGRILLVMFLALFNTLPVYAAVTADVTLLATPAFSGGIINFIVTYINDTRVDINWGFVPTANVTAIMIRAKYGVYPDDIPNVLTAPSDGYLVYSGNGTSVSDTSMNFDETLATLYYKAWAKKTDGTWVMSPYMGETESAIMTLLGILGLVGILTWASFRGRNLLVSLAATLAWLFLFAYTRNNPIKGVTIGSFTDSLLIFICWGMAIGLPIYTYMRGRNERMLGEKGFIFGDNGSVAGNEKPMRIKEKGLMSQSTEEYADTIHRALHPNGAYRRRR